MIREVSYGLMVACFVSGALAGDPRAVRAPWPQEGSVAVSTPVPAPIAAGMNGEGDSVAAVSLVVVAGGNAVPPVELARGLVPPEAAATPLAVIPLGVVSAWPAPR